MLCAGSGAGKTVACIAAYFHCLPRALLRSCFTGSSMLDEPNYLGMPPLAQFVPVWLPIRLNIPSLQQARGKTVDENHLPVLLDLLWEAARPDDGTEEARRWGEPGDAQRKRIETWLQYGPPLLVFVDLNTVELGVRRVLAAALKQFQNQGTFGRYGHRCIVTYRSTRSDDEVMNWLRDSQHFLFFDMYTIGLEQAKAYMRTVRLFDAKARTYLQPGDQAVSQDSYPDVIEEECRLLEDLVTRHVRSGESIISTPLLMHLVSLLHGGGLAGVVTLAQLYERVVLGFLERDLRGPITSAGLKGDEGKKRVLTALTRVTLAILARGANVTRLASQDEVKDLLRYPQEGAPGGTCLVPWWPESSRWAKVRRRRVPYYYEEFGRKKDSREVEEMQEFSLLRRDAEGVGFLHDSFLYFFAGVYALRHYLGPVLPLPRPPTGKVGPVPLAPLPRLDPGWYTRVVERVQPNPDQWALPAEFLGGVLAVPELRELATQVLVASPGDGLPRFLFRLLRGRAQDADQVLNSLSEVVIRPEVHGLPEILFTAAFEHLWAKTEKQTDQEFTSFLQTLGRLMPHSWVRQCRPLTCSSVLKMAEHSGHVHALAVLQDGRVASGCTHGTIKLWDLISGQVQTIAEDEGWVSTLKVLPDGQVAWWSKGAIVKVWDPTSGQVQTMAEQQGRVSTLELLPDSRMVPWSEGATVKVRVPTSDQVLTMAEHKGKVHALAVLPDGRVASGSEDETVIVWDPTSGQVLTMAEHRNDVCALAVLPDNRVASGSWDYTVKVWDPATDQVQTMVERSDRVTALAVLPDGRVASGSEDGIVRVWDLTIGQVQTMAEHSGAVYALAGLMDGRVVSGGSDSTVKVWDPASEHVHTTAKHRGRVIALAVLPDGRVVSGSEDRTVKMWDPASKTEQTMVEHRGKVVALAVLQDGRVASGSWDHTVKVWDPATARVQRIAVRRDRVHALAVLPGGWVVSGGEDCIVTVWDPASEHVHTTAKHRGRVVALAVLQDGRVASGSCDKTVKVWDPVSGQVQTMAEHSGWVTVLAVLPDGRVVSGSNDHTVKVWDPSRGQVQTLAEHTGGVRSVAVLPDGRVASGSEDKTVKVWDPASGQVQTMAEHSRGVTALAVLPGGRVASGSEDKTVKVWDPGSGEILTYFSGSTVECLAVRDGYPWVLVAGLKDGRVLELEVVDPAATGTQVPIAPTSLPNR